MGVGVLAFFQAHLHVCARADHKAEVHGHGPHVRARLTADPEDGQVALLVVLNQLGEGGGAGLAPTLSTAS